MSHRIPVHAPPPGLPATTGGTYLTARRRVAVCIVALVGAGLALFCASPSPATATPPGHNGRITFHREDDAGFTQVWTANPDLTAEHQVTSGRAYSGWAVWAPDGSRIAFDSDRSDPDPSDGVLVNDVFTMRADGSDVRKLTDSVGFSGDAAYSPNGALLAFDADRGVDSGAPDPPSSLQDLSVFVMNVDGSGVRQVTTPPLGSSDTEPRFSPDGTRMVFTRFQGGHFFESGRVVGDTSAVFTVALDGSDLRRVTGWGLKAGQADWSPDGTAILFEQACCRLGAGGIFRVSSEGGAFSAIVNGHGFTGRGNETALQVDGYYDPVWSPNGSTVLAGREFLDQDGNFRSGLVVVDADGSDLRWVSPGAHDEHQPDWGTAPLE